MTWSEFKAKHTLAGPIANSRRLFSVPSQASEEEFLRILSTPLGVPADVLRPLLSPTTSHAEPIVGRSWMHRFWQIAAQEIATAEHAKKVAGCRVLWDRLLNGEEYTCVEALPYILRDIEGFTAWAKKHDTAYLFAFDFSELGGLFSLAQPEKIQRFEQLITWYRRAARALEECDVDVLRCEGMPTLRSGSMQLVSVSIV